jgi:general secretion pathway protein F
VPGVPPVYLAIVEAGVRAGRLPAALEGLADAACRLAKLRRVCGLALAYPLAVLLTAYFLSLFLMTQVSRILTTLLDDSPTRIRPLIEFLSRIGAWALQWWWAPPLVLIVLVALWWRATSYSLILQSGVGSRWLGWIPWFGKLQRYLQLAAFTKTLALLVENHQPLPESVVLAAQATGSRRLTRTASQARLAIASGAPPADELRRCGLPPLICWLLGGSTAQPDLAGTLHRCISSRTIISSEPPTRPSESACCCRWSSPWEWRARLWPPMR